MRRRNKVIFGVGVVILSAVSVLDHAGVFGFRKNDRQRYHGVDATVTRFLNNEMLEIDLPDGNRPRTLVRLMGIQGIRPAEDSMAGDPEQLHEADDFAKEQIVGQKVRLALDPNGRWRDREGRLLAYVFLVDEKQTGGDVPGPLVNELLIAGGYASADQDYGHVLKTRFARVEDKASRK